ncbi:hypothetical protein, partial [Streptococcus suis]|uniref:hypothetical protein n=1 Tax=Streptococcus suis TaxID=1307 RepID=UPI003703DED3
MSNLSKIVHKTPDRQMKIWRFFWELRTHKYLFFLLILFKKQKLTYNRFMKLTIEQTKELKTYLKDKTYSPFH